MKIHLISTGGTIVSVPGEHGLAPAENGGIAGWLKSSFPCHEFSFNALMNLDSSNIGPEQWRGIAAAAWGALGDNGGVIIAHGTDTMAYTSSALGFMLRGLKKPVTLTGSQIPFGNPLSDAPSNLALAVAAVENAVSGVTISFGDIVINGVRAVKTSTSAMRAFESSGAPTMATLTASGLGVASRAACAPDAPASLENNICADVFLLKLVPGANPEIFGALRGMGFKGVVVEAFGAGNVPFAGRDISDAVRRAVAEGMAVVTRSQCLRGKVDMSAYETGMRLLDAGAISAGDMTTEAAVVKLMWALGQTRDTREIGRMFRTDFAGEITI
ncbi:MAG: asparaginase [Synergistaceae bacterium]|jgi:L-asparaginase|nr:asparaginase [Synergistaceae bacterium]